MKNVLLIADSYRTANFNVMLSIIRSLSKDIIIHAITMWGDKIPKDNIDKDVRYYFVPNKENEFKEKLPAKIRTQISFYINIVNMIKSSYVISSDTKRVLTKCEEIISANEISFVFSAFHPNFAHEVAILLCKRHPQVKKYQFWFDHFTNANFNFDTSFRRIIGKFYLQRLKKIEHHYFQFADKIYALPETFIDDNLIAEFKDKLILFEIPYIMKFEYKTLSEDITFAGSFDSCFRDPQPVFDIILEAQSLIKQNFTFKFFVNAPHLYSEIKNKSFGKIQVNGFLSRKKLEKQLSESMMLLTIGNKRLKMMPSKTVEYVSYRKPILYFYADDNDTSKRYLDYYPDVCRIDVREDRKKNASKLANFLNSIHNPICYEELMKIKVFQDSTPEHIQELIML